MQIIPAIDLRDGKCVRLRQGDYNQETVFSDDPVTVAKRWRKLGAERLHLVDLDGARLGRPVNVEVVRSIVQAVDVPCQLGGGLRETADLALMLDNVGVDRLIVGTQALKQRDWFERMVQRYPGRLMLGIDARNSLVATEGWLDVSETSALALARQYSSLELAAIIYTNIANDGMLAGIDEGTLADLAQLSQIGPPIIASGGVTTEDDVRHLVRISRDNPNLVGAIVGRALYEGTLELAPLLHLVRVELTR